MLSLHCAGLVSHSLPGSVTSEFQFIRRNGPYVICGYFAWEIEPLFKSNIAGRQFSAISS